MKVVILAGGLGTRLAEETEVRPKPMVEIGGRPILWHIMKHYAHYGFNEFVVALGYKGEVIKRYFLDYYAAQRRPDDRPRRRARSSRTTRERERLDASTSSTPALDTHDGRPGQAAASRSSATRRSC